MTEAFICDYIRTPIGRFGGALSSVRADDLGAVPLKALMARHPGARWAAVDEVDLGCANQAGEDNRNVARMALLLAGLPVERARHHHQPPLRLGHGCGDHRRPRHQGRRGRAGDRRRRRIDDPRALRHAQGGARRSRATPKIYDTTIGWRFVNPLMEAQYGVDSMPETGENVAEDFQIQRAPTRMPSRCARSSVPSPRRQSGRLAEEIVPVDIPQRQGRDRISSSKDEHPRADTTLEALAKLDAGSRNGGTVTAGNASGVNDGAAALIIASEAAARAPWPDAARRMLGRAAAGVPPRIMGIGPVPATRKLLRASASPSAIST